MEQEKCTLCNGVGEFKFTHPNGKLKNQPCVCKGTGLKVDQLKSDCKTKDIQIRQLYKELKELQTWLRENSTCKTCGGDVRKTWGGIKCEECGLLGNAPWPG